MTFYAYKFTSDTLTYHDAWPSITSCLEDAAGLTHDAERVRPPVDFKLIIGTVEAADVDEARVKTAQGRWANQLNLGYPREDK